MKIYNFDSRNLIIWELLKDHFKLSTNQIFREIGRQYSLMIELLQDINVPYNELKNILVPQKKKKEICFVFDSLRIEHTCYGGIILNQIMPSILGLEKVAVFYGDLIGPQHREGQFQLKELLKKEIISDKALEYQYSNQYFLVFLNNMTDNRLDTIQKTLSGLNHYMGYLDITYQNHMKDIVSASISQRLLKYKNIIIVDSTEDGDEGIHQSLYDFRNSNYTLTSIDETIYRSFLCFKICRHYYEFDRKDCLLSLNTATEAPTFIDDFNIIIDDRKFKYLLETKYGSLSITKLVNLNVR